MSTTTIIMAQLEVEHCAAELFLNGIPVVRLTEDLIPITNVAAEALIVPGTNKLEVLVAPGSRPSTARTEYREMDFRAMRAVGRLIRFNEGVPGLKEHGEVLGETSFVWAEPRPSRRAFPAEIGTQIELFGAHGKWAWQDAPPLVLDAALVAEAAALLDDVERAIRRGDADRVWKLTEHQIRDVQRAFPALTESHLRGELATLIGHASKAADPVFKRDPSRFDFRVVAGGRMLECLDDDWSTSFKLRDPGDGSPVPYRILMARIENRLQIVR
jgi:hypothetical protein